MLKLKTKIKKYTVAILIIVVFACGAINMIDQAGEFGIFLGQKYNLVNSVTGDRITSYNVCYTKLLRSGSLRETHRQVEIIYGKLLKLAK